MRMFERIDLVDAINGDSDTIHVIVDVVDRVNSSGDEFRRMIVKNGHRYFEIKYVKPNGRYAFEFGFSPELIQGLPVKATNKAKKLFEAI